MRVSADDVFMSQWVIFKYPLDYPHHFVVRENVIVKGQPEPLPAFTACLCDTLAEARRCVPPGRYNMGRAYEEGPEANPFLFEVWI